MANSTIQNLSANSNVTFNTALASQNPGDANATKVLGSQLANLTLLSGLNATLKSMNNTGDFRTSGDNSLPITPTAPMAGVGVDSNNNAHSELCSAAGGVAYIDLTIPTFDFKARISWDDAGQQFVINLPGGDFRIQGTTLIWPGIVQFGAMFAGTTFLGGNLTVDGGAQINSTLSLMSATAIVFPNAGANSGISSESTLMQIVTEKADGTLSLQGPSSGLCGVIALKAIEVNVPNNITIGGNLNIPGAISYENLTVNNNLSSVNASIGNDLVVTNNLTAQNASIDGMSAGNLTVLANALVAGNSTVNGTLQIGGVPGTLTTPCTVTIDGDQAKIALAGGLAAGFHLSSNSSASGSQAFVIYVNAGNLTIAPTGDDGTGQTTPIIIDHAGSNITVPASWFNASDWATAVPATIAEAINRIAAVVSVSGASPIP